MTINSERLQTIISEQLQPVAKKVDEEAYYAEAFLYTLGKEGFFSSEVLSNKLMTEVLLIGEHSLKKFT